jgi:hypothetical protein
MSGSIEITVDVKGEAVVRAVGFAGPSCREATRSIERALGVVASEALTAEFHQSQPAEQAVRHSS